MVSHLITLRSSVQQSGESVDVAAIIDAAIDPGVPGGRHLIELARSALGTDPGPAAVHALASTLGLAAALTAVEAASAFSMVNRVMMATGQPSTAPKIARATPDLRILDAERFNHTTVIPRQPSAKRLVGRLRKRMGGR